MIIFDLILKTNFTVEYDKLIRVTIKKCEDFSIDDRFKKVLKFFKADNIDYLSIFKNILLDLETQKENIAISELHAIDC